MSDVYQYITGDNVNVISSERILKHSLKNVTLSPSPAYNSVKVASTQLASDIDTF